MERVDCCLLLEIEESNDDLIERKDEVCMMVLGEEEGEDRHC
jgi:hypothetical protein